jgi:hypothetical protein
MSIDMNVLVENMTGGSQSSFVDNFFEVFWPNSEFVCEIFGRDYPDLNLARKQSVVDQNIFIAIVYFRCLPEKIIGW